MTWIVDPGHGGADAGAVGHGIREKDWVLALGVRMASLAPAIALTREDDTFTSPNGKAQKANRLGTRADRFMSLHLNAYAPRPAARGFEVFHAPGSRAGKALAEKVHGVLMPKFPSGWPDRGVKTAPFTVLTNTEMPAVLIEFGFVTNGVDAAWLRSEESRVVMAEALVYEVMGFERPGGADKEPVVRPDLQSELEELGARMWELTEQIERMRQAVAEQ